MILDTWVPVELDELECRWRRRWPRLAMDDCMVAICWTRINISVWKSSNCSSSRVSTRWNLCLMPCCILQCCPLVMNSSSPSKMGSSSSLEVAICAREPLPLIMMEQDQVKGKMVQIQGWRWYYLDLPWMIGLDEWFNPRNNRKSTHTKKHMQKAKEGV